MSQEPGRAECECDECECAETFASSGATEEGPPQNQDDSKTEGEHHAHTEAFDTGHECFYSEPREPLQDDGGDGGPHSEGSLRGSHAPLYSRRPRLASSL